ncbi:hypothetical protein E0Z10_g1707 [Xylaria hypoxylon]|uniref:Uncharacterized protein n=1 Tax=Xylaria hypoxylon TaxID=37992 RepID=A0A4Z0Z855_9PEZI|nr:hypothetical protein E0Z10_g1707 [Xylaria hypoxylon]
MSHANPECVHSFIPAPADIEIEPGPPPVTTPGEYTDLPLISDANWDKVATAFRLPGHYDKVVERKVTSVVSIPRTYSFNGNFKEKLWMHVAMTRRRYSPREYPAFALAATHFQTQNITFAIMVGCSEQQIGKVESLVQGWGDAVGHPLLMLGICAELHLDRLESLTIQQDSIYRNLLNSVQANATSDSNDKFSWELIKEVRNAREESKRVEAEVNTTRLQLSNAVSSSISKLLAQYEAQYDTSRRQNNNTSGRMSADMKGKSTAHYLSSSLSDISDTDSMVAKLQREWELKTETTHLFEERFNDILSRLDGLSAQCRISVEGISFTTDIIRSELAREEAQIGRREASISAKNTKIGVAISFIALTYLPLTAVASIMGMPIFQWTNDWRDWRYNPVGRGNSPTTGTNPEIQLPVVSGYIAVYFPIAIGLMVITLSSFAYYYNSQGIKKYFSRALEKTRRLYHTVAEALAAALWWLFLRLLNKMIAVQGQLARPKDEPLLTLQKSSTPPSQQVSSVLQQPPSTTQSQLQVTSQQQSSPPLQRSSPRPQRDPETLVPSVSSQTSRAALSDIGPDMELKPISVGRSAISSQGQLSAVVASPSKPQGNNDDHSLHSYREPKLETRPNPASETGAAKTSDVTDEEKKILSSTPGHQKV